MKGLCARRRGYGITGNCTASLLPGGGFALPGLQLHRTAGEGAKTKTATFRLPFAITERSRHQTMPGQRLVHSMPGRCYTSRCTGTVCTGTVYRGCSRYRLPCTCCSRSTPRNRQTYLRPETVLLWLSRSADKRWCCSTHRRSRSG